MRAALVVLTVMLALPTVATAAVRYTDPAAAVIGAGAVCSEASPCALVDAVNHAAAGDEVRLRTEEYWLEGTLSVSVPDLTISGPAGRYAPSANRAWIFFRPQSGECPTCPSSTSVKITVTANGDRLTLRRLNLTARTLGGTMLNGLLSSVMTLDQVQIEDEGSARAVVAQDLRMSNSVIRQSSASASDVALEATGEITGSTVTSDGGIALSNDDNWHLASAGDRCDLVVRNSISLGTSRNLKAEDTGSDCVPSVAVSESWIPQTGTGGGIQQLKPPENPDLINFISGNLADSPAALTTPFVFGIAAITPTLASTAVNAGCAACLAQDFYGRPRPIGPGIDIGAIEIPLPPTVVAPTASAVTASAASLSAAVNPNGLATAYSLLLRRADGGTWTTLASATSGEGAGAEPVTAAATTLQADTVYEARLVASNDVGSAESATTSFRTPPSSGGGSGGGTVATVRILSLSARAGVVRTRVRATGPGVLIQRITSVGRTRPAWCGTRRSIAAAGDVAVSCRLNRRAQAQLRRAAMRLSVQTVFTPASGTRTSVVRTVRMPRR